MFSTIMTGHIDDVVQTSAKGLSIKGQITEKDAPIPCRVRLYEKLSGRLLMEKVTDDLGNYEFDHLTNTRYFLIAHHPELKYNAVIQDNVVPK